jgi:hypothetical protein
MNPTSTTIGKLAHLRRNAVAYLALFVALGGTSAYAANELLPKGSVGAKQIRKAAVSAKKLKANAVTTDKVADRTLLAEDFAPGVLGGVAGPGTSGSDGATGAAGAAGPRGPQGETGARGETGAQGPQGEAGPQGAAGATGERGPAGPQGERGAMGPQGERGVAGPQGERGPAGPQGPTGAAGFSGYQRVSTAINGPADFHSGQAVCPAGKEVIGGGVWNHNAGGSADLEIHYSYPRENYWTASVKFEDGDRNWSTTIYAICAYVNA